MEHVSDVLSDLRQQLSDRRDSELQEAAFVLPHYVTDHNDTAAYRKIDRQINQLARAWDRMIASLDKWHAAAGKIEESCENFYGD